VPSFRKAALLYNPAAGSRAERLRRDVEAVAAVFQAAGIAAEVVATRGPGTASLQALELVLHGCDCIVACGGDGTVNETMQQMVAMRLPASLGVVPLGTGNGLAADLGISSQPRAAAQALLQAEPRRIAVGKMEWEFDPVDRETSPESEAGRSRYFMIAAGAGADAEIIYQLSNSLKRRTGKAAYYLQGWRLFWTHKFPLFEADWVTMEGKGHRATVGQVLLLRIADFGGLTRHIAPGADLFRDELRLAVFRSVRRRTIVRHSIAATLNRFWNIPGVEFVSARQLTCRFAETAGAEGPVRVQVDGELLGSLPVRFSIVPDAITLLAPRR